MSSDDIPKNGQKSSRLLVAIGALVFSALPLRLGSQSLAPASDTLTTGTLGNLHADKRVVRTGRWIVVREFSIDFAVKDSTIFCGELTTTDASEANDLIGSSGQPVDLVEKGKDLYLTLKSGRKIRARRLTSEKCPRT